jgi:hypothetical protein
LMAGLGTIKDSEKYAVTLSGVARDSRSGDRTAHGFMPTMEIRERLLLLRPGGATIKQSEKYGLTWALWSKWLINHEKMLLLLLTVGSALSTIQTGTRRSEACGRDAELPIGTSSGTPALGMASNT